MKILFFISKLYGGGAERSATILLNHLSDTHDVTAAIFENAKTSYPISHKIRIIDLSKGKRIRPYQLNRIIKCRNTIKRENPDLVISFLVGLNRFTVIANCLLRKKLILSEHTSLQAKQPAWEWLTRHLLYRLATKVVLISESDYKYAKWLKNKTFIYNPLSCRICTDLPQKKCTIVAIGSQRRWRVKGFDLLVQAWAKIAKSHPEWKLQFIGENNDDYISNLSKSLNIESQVEFLGWTDEIDKLLQLKSIYILSSRREGFPCSLLEAMSQGCASLAFDCKTGPNEIIADGRNGLLVHNGDISELAEKLQLLIKDEKLRKKLSIAAIADAKRFEQKNIMAQWDNLISETTKL